MGGQVQSKPAPGYSVETITVAGMSIKGSTFYSDGTVFAVAVEWDRGSRFRLLLGTHPTSIWNAPRSCRIRNLNPEGP